MIALRKGPNMLFIRTHAPVDTLEKMEKYGIASRVTLEEGIRNSDEKCSLFFLTDVRSITTNVEEALYILLSESNSSEALSQLINTKMAPLLSRVDIATRSLVMRIPGNEDRIMKALIENYGGKTIHWKEGIRQGRSDQSLVWLTNKPLMSRLKEEDVLGDHLLINVPAEELYDHLRRNVLLYISHSMGEDDWYEYRINIYDSYGDYDKHYKRLMHVVTALEMGYVLGESWTKDHALILLSVVAYQIRLFSFMPPEETKAILMGLEYDEKGNRLVDMDLYYRNNKIGWIETQKKTKTAKDKRSKKEEGIYQHQALKKKLNS